MKIWRSTLNTYLVWRLNVVVKAAIHDATMYPATAADNIVARYNFVAGTRPTSPNLTFS